MSTFGLRGLLTASFVLLVTVCTPVTGEDRPATEETLPSLPLPVSNNAVALIAIDGGYKLFSMLGLNAGKTWRDITSQAVVFSSLAGNWQPIAPVPGSAGRLAASAVAVGSELYVFGGYTVMQDGSEESAKSVYRLQQDSGEWEWFSDMPVPVDDSILLTYQDRYVYLVSGWHDLGNVNLVQVLDTATATWKQATPYPGTPVFGHAGGISGSQLVVCDGVRTAYPEDGSARKFLSSPACWMGEISASDYRRIHWRPIAPHPGSPRYRMAAGSDEEGRVFFAGGSTNPYNFDGIGYDGVSATAESGVLSFNTRDKSWSCHGNLSVATMDHRGLPWHDGWFYLIGGMRDKQQVSAGVFRFSPEAARGCTP